MVQSNDLPLLSHFGVPALSPTTSVIFPLDPNQTVFISRRKGFAGSCPSDTQSFLYVPGLAQHRGRAPGGQSCSWAVSAGPGDAVFSLPMSPGPGGSQIKTSKPGGLDLSRGAQFALREMQ